MPAHAQMFRRLEKLLHPADACGAAIHKFLSKIPRRTVILIPSIVAFSGGDGFVGIQMDQIFGNGLIIPAAKAQRNQPFGNGFHVI